MPANDSFEFNYTPGYTKPTHEFGQPYGDEFHAEAVEELLLSTQGYTQRGVTLAPGLGVLPTGTILARSTSLGLYFPYLGTATDGRGVAVGILRDSRDTGGSGYTSATAWQTATGLTLGDTTHWPSSTSTSPTGKIPTASLGNLVIRGILNGNQISGTDTTSLVSGTAGGVSSTVITALGGRLVALGGSVAGQPAPFPGGPMDGQYTATSGVVTTGVSAFIF